MKRCIAIALTIAVLLTLSVFTGSAVARYKGDLDGDGTVIAGEARKILRMSAKLDPSPAPGTEAFRLADVNGDGQLLANDARTTLRISAKLEPNIPLEESASITVCLGTDPGSLDPVYSVSTDSASVLCHLFSGLTRWSVDADGHPVIVADAAKALPDRAENDDGTVTYTYVLRDGLKWSDGKPVTAGDFVFAWNRAASPYTESEYGYMLDVIDGYGKMNDLLMDGTPANPDAKLNAVAADDKTVKVTLVNDVPYWNELTANPVFFPVREDVAANPEWGYNAETFVCNGRYLLSEWNHDASITVVRNAAHPDAGSVTMEEIRFLMSEDEEYISDKFREDELVFADGVTPEAQMAFPGAFRTIGELGTYYFNWNVNAEILPEGSGLTGAEAEKARAEIRRAISLLIDRSYMLENVAGIGQVPASTFVSTGITDADGTEFYLHAGNNDGFTGYYDVSPEAAADNRDKAIEILKSYYGWDDAAETFTDFPTLKYLYNSSSAHQAIAEYIRDTLAKYDIAVELREEGWNDYRAVLEHGEFTMARNGWIADFNDPITFLDMWLSVSGNNSSGLGTYAHSSVKAYDLDLTPYGIDVNVKNGTWAQTYDVLISVIKRTKDDDTRYKLMHLAEDMLMETGCICPIYYYTDAFLIDPHLKGFYTNPLGYKYFAYTTYEKAE